jgi:hypothetical protein
MTDYTTCFECDASVPVNEWADHECPPDPDYDPAEPWMDDIWIDDSDEEVGA